MSRITHNPSRLAKIVADLEALAAAEGITLPFPAEIIAAMEAHGHLIDLATGHLIGHGADQRVWPTTVLEAELFVETLTGGF